MKKVTLAVVVMLLAVAALAQTASTPSATPAPLAQPTVYDANGKMLGQLVSFDDNTASGLMLYQLADTNVVSIRLKRTAQGVVYGNASDVYYEQLDCKGPAFLPVHNSFGDLASAVDVDGNLLTADTDGPHDVVRFQSTWKHDAQGCENSPGGADAAPAAVATHLPDSMKPPFAVHGVGRTRSVSP